jgi:hypothetical protein
VLLRNDGRDTSFTPLLRREHQLIYEDSNLCLYAHRTVLEAARR